MSSAAPKAWLDRYELLGPLGTGGFSTVHEARVRGTGERVALKELTRISERTLARFKQEFRAVQEVLHPNLVRLDALFEDRGKWMIAMELVEGRQLLHHLYTDETALGFRESELRDVFTQLAEGLTALHEAGFVHLDLKPSNILVTSEGRVVLLDFGLATALDARDGAALDDVAGTAAYMAPEQAGERELGPAADWYAFGVCLYEALTGLLPIERDNPLELLSVKQVEVPPRPSLHAPTVAADLDALCGALLALDPAARPDGDAVRAALARQPAPARGSGQPLRDSGRPFEGREPELHLLSEALTRVQSGAHAVVLVEGDSGIGKSALVKHFLTGLGRSTPEPWMFRSRCYENELLAFKAFDGVVDGIARVVAQLSDQECRELLPPNAALLCRVFPALAQAPRLSERPMLGVAADPAVQRLEAFGLLARILQRLSERAPIVITIDDLQWADTDSFRLLQALLAGQQVPRVLILATLRPRNELEGDAAREIEALRRLPGVTDLELVGLPRPQASRLARELMGREMPDLWLDVVVRESAGHPLFLTVLTRFAESHDPKTATELTLDAAIAAQIGSLSSKARRLLETSALVGSPLALPVCGQAAQLNESDRRRVVAELCSRKMLQRRGAGKIACFHDRIRRVVVESLPGPQARALHAQIAAALAGQPDTDPAQLAQHHEAAGQLEQAHRAYRLAAEKALLHLAFARAAALYQRALDVSADLPLPKTQRCVLHTALGHALARGGRSAEAALQYQAAAAHADGEDQTRFSLWAAQHLLQSADVLTGMQAARSLLSELGLPLPAGPAGTLAQLLWHRALLGVSGLDVTTSTEPIRARDQVQLDALAGLSLPVAWCDPLAGAALNARHLRLSRAAGAPTHLARALAEEAYGRSLQSPFAPEIDRLLERARELAKDTQDPALEVFLAFREATTAIWRWQLPRVRERSEHALQVCHASCLDQPWLLTNVRTVLSSSWANLGDHARLASACDAWLGQARERNDRFALAMIEGLGFGSFRHLMVDDPDRAREALAVAMAPWPVEPFAFAHMGELIGVTHIELYRGGDSLVRWFDAELPRLSRSLLLKQPFGKGMMLMYRGLAALAAKGVAAPERGRRLLNDLRKYISVMKRLDSALARLMAISFEAQLAALSGKPELALTLAREVRERSRACGHDLEPRFSYFEGLIEGGEGGLQKREAALKFFADQGWKFPRRALAMLCPALDELER